MDKNQEIAARIQEIGHQGKTTLKEKLQRIAEELADYLETGVYFCGIRGKRWSFVAGSGDVLSGSHRIRLSETWGLISDRELKQDQFIRLIISMIREVLTD